MARLAEYMGKIATLLGEKSHVHFVRLEKGGAVLLQDVEREAQLAVRERIHAVRADTAPPDMKQACEALDGLLADDGASGYLSDDAGEAPGARLLEFAGATRNREVACGPITETSELEGVVIRVGGELSEVPVHLHDGEVVHICHAERELARTLAGHIFGQVLRVVGKARWNRHVDGRWSMIRFAISDFEPLKHDSLGNIVADLQRVAAGTRPDALETLRTLRQSEE